MTDPLTDIIRKLGGLHQMLSKELTGDELGYVVVTSMANLAGNLSPEYFAEMTEHMGEPCERAGCTCHKVGEAVKAALVACRKDHQRVTALSGKING
jgi:F0F1-type ATP synthase gamma subunit